MKLRTIALSLLSFALLGNSSVHAEDTSELLVDIVETELLQTSTENSPAPAALSFCCELDAGTVLFTNATLNDLRYCRNNGNCFWTSYAKLCDHAV